VAKTLFGDTTFKVAPVAGHAAVVIASGSSALAFSRTWFVLLPMPQKPLKTAEWRESGRTQHEDRKPDWITELDRERRTKGARHPRQKAKRPAGIPSGHQGAS
jgi:hypothetical protein